MGLRHGCMGVGRSSNTTRKEALHSPTLQHDKRTIRKKKSIENNKCVGSYFYFLLKLEMQLQQKQQNRGKITKKTK
jgi:hypothetical protein